MAYHPFRNPGLKLISLTLAALLWVTVSRDQIVERSVRVPLEFQSVPDGIEIVGDPPGTVDVRVRGASNQLGSLDPGDVVAVLDLRGARVGQRLFHLLTGQVRAPFGIEVEQVSPPTVSLAFERSASKTVPVVPAIEGTPAPGFTVLSVSAEPAWAEVVGPESQIARLTSATTEPVSVEGASRSVRDVVTIGVVDSALRLQQGRTATVTVTVGRTAVDRTLGPIAVTARNLERGRRMVAPPDGVRVVVRGPGGAIDALPTTALSADVDAAGLTGGRHRLPVRVTTTRPDVQIVRVEPTSVSVRIQ